MADGLSATLASLTPTPRHADAASPVVAASPRCGLLFKTSSRSSVFPSATSPSGNASHAGPCGTIPRHFLWGLKRSCVSSFSRRLRAIGLGILEITLNSLENVGGRQLRPNCNRKFVEPIMNVHLNAFCENDVHLRFSDCLNRATRRNG